MRILSSFALAILTAGIFSTHGLASSQTYCELFAKDFADGRTTDVDLWQNSYRNAFNDCMNQYTAVAPVAAPKKQLQKQAAVPLAAPETSEEAAAVVKPKLKLEPGTEAWNEYCAAKYKSFNPDTGTYNSHTGKERRCTVTQ
jgi:hypothetical protein